MQAARARCALRAARCGALAAFPERSFAAYSTASYGVSYVYPAAGSGQGAPVPMVGKASVPEASAPAEGSVRVAFLAAGVSSLDLSMLAKASKADEVAGLEGVAKVVAAASAGSGPQPGALVVPRRVGAFGTFREHAELPVGDVMSLPSAVPVEIAATIGVAPRAAWAALAQLKVERGDLVVIGGAETPMGQAAVQLASSRGVRVLAVVSDKDGESWKPMSQLLKIGGAECVVPESSAVRPGNGTSEVFEELGKGVAGLSCCGAVGSAAVKGLVAVGGKVMDVSEELASGTSETDSRMWDELVALAASGKLRLWLRKMKLSEIGTAFEQTRGATGSRKIVLFTKEGERALQSTSA